MPPAWISQCSSLRTQAPLWDTPLYFPDARLFWRSLPLPDDFLPLPVSESVPLPPLYMFLSVFCPNLIRCHCLNSPFPATQNILSLSLHCSTTDSPETTLLLVIITHCVSQSQRRQRHGSNLFLLAAECPSPCYQGVCNIGKDYVSRMKSFFGVPKLLKQTFYQSDTN